MRYLQLKLTGNQEKFELFIAQSDPFGFEAFAEDGNCLVTSVPLSQVTTEWKKSIGSLADDCDLAVEWVEVEDQNWNAMWEASIKPIRFGQWLGVRSDFHAPMDDCALQLVITPQMAFGTGHHETTALMIEAMRHLNFQSKSCLDFGAGTGILGILAEKLGAGEIWCIESDREAMPTLEANIQLNDCQVTEAVCADSPIVVTGSRFDIILVNITRNIILQHLASLVSRLAVGGYILLSGFTVDDEPMVIRSCKRHALKLVNSAYKHDWSLVQFRVDKYR